MYVCMYLDVHQMDVTMECRQGDLEHDIYMNQPEGDIHEKQQDMACKPKPSTRYWTLKLNSFMKTSGYLKNAEDPCIYVKAGNNGTKKLRACWYYRALVQH